MAESSNTFPAVFHVPVKSRTFRVFGFSLTAFFDAVTASSNTFNHSSTSERGKQSQGGGGGGFGLAGSGGGTLRFLLRGDNEGNFISLKVQIYIYISSYSVSSYLCHSEASLGCTSIGSMLATPIIIDGNKQMINICKAKHHQDKSRSRRIHNFALPLND